MKFKIGDKVKIPKTKTAKGWSNSIEDSNVIIRAKQLNQNYLFVTEISSDIVLNEVMGLHIESGDFFSESDLELYEEELNKKIVGYKAPYDLFKGRIKAGNIFTKYSNDKFVMYNEKHMTSGIPTEIVETWQPIYEEQYKIGDWVVWEDNGYIAEIKSKCKICPNCWNLTSGEEGVYTSCNQSGLRLATKEEIEKSIQLPIINSYEGKLEGDYIIYGSNCAKLKKSWFKNIADVLAFSKIGENRTIKSIRLNTDVEISIQDIEQICKYIKHHEK